MVDDIWARTERAGIPHPVRDDELRMMFTCAHPALDRDVAAGADAAADLRPHGAPRSPGRCCSPRRRSDSESPGPRARFGSANIPLRVPPSELLPERTPHVLGCIYSVFTEGYWSTAGPSAIRDELCDEGVRLAAELCSLMPSRATRTHWRPLCCCMIRGAPPGWTTTALWCRSTNRTAAGGTAAGSPADCSACSWPRAQTGAYLPQAVIAAVHATAPELGADRLGDDLRGLRPPARRSPDSPVVRANRALAIGFRDGFDAGLAALDEVADDPRLARSSTVPSIRADLLRRAGRIDEARSWYRKGSAARAVLTPGHGDASCRMRRLWTRMPAHAAVSGTSRIGLPTSASGPSKCHHSPEYTDSPPAAIPSRSQLPVGLLLGCDAVGGESLCRGGEVVEAGAHVDRPAVVAVDQRHVHRAAGLVAARVVPGRATQFGSGMSVEQPHLHRRAGGSSPRTPASPRGHETPRRPSASPGASDSCTRQRASAGYSGVPTKLSGVAYCRSTTASGIDAADVDEAGLRLRRRRASAAATGASTA